MYLDYLLHLQNRGLLETLRKLKSTVGSGHIVVFNTLAIGHTKHPSSAFLHGRFRGKNWGHPIIKTLSSYAVIFYLEYLDYMSILAFISYIANLAFSVRSGSLVGSVQLENYLRMPHTVSSSVCLAHYFNIGETCAGACRRHWNHPAHHVQGDKRLSWRIMRLQERRWWRQSMVVHQ